MYELIFDVKAVNSIGKLETAIQKRIMDKLILAQQNPFHSFIRLSGRKEYRMRVGDYRIIADIMRGKIIVLQAGHRRKIYKSLDNQDRICT